MVRIEFERRMTVEYDPEADSAYIRFRNGKVNKTTKETGDVLLDFDSRNRLLGIELVDAKSPGLRDLLSRLAARHHRPGLARLNPRAFSRIYLPAREEANL